MYAIRLNGSAVMNSDFYFLYLVSRESTEDGYLYGPKRVVIEKNTK
jgi:hypothetical protein